MFIWKCKNANRFSVRGRFRVMVGLGDRKYCLVSIKVMRSLWKVPTIHRNKRVCVCVILVLRSNWNNSFQQCCMMICAVHIPLSAVTSIVKLFCSCFYEWIYVLFSVRCPSCPRSRAVWCSWRTPSSRSISRRRICSDCRRTWTKLSPAWITSSVIITWPKTLIRSSGKGECDLRLLCSDRPIYRPDVIGWEL